MKKNAQTHSMDDVLACVERFSEGASEHTAKAMFYFLYKEILVNRLNIFEADAANNRAGIEHTEKIINDLNIKLMEQLAKK